MGHHLPLPPWSSRVLTRTKSRTRGKSQPWFRGAHRRHCTWSTAQQMQAGLQQPDRRVGWCPDPEHSRSRGRGRHGAAGRWVPARLREMHPQQHRDGLGHGEPMPLSAPRPSQSPVLLSQPLITSPPTGRPPQPLTTTCRPRRRSSLLSQPQFLVGSAGEEALWGKTPSHRLLPVFGGASSGKRCPMLSALEERQETGRGLARREASAPDVGPAHRPQDHISSLPTNPSQTRVSQ